MYFIYTLYLRGILARIELESQLFELLQDFLEGLAAKVPDLHHLLGGLVAELFHRVDSCTLEAVVGTDGEVQVLNLLLEFGIYLYG